MNRRIAPTAAAAALLVMLLAGCSAGAGSSDARSGESDSGMVQPDQPAGGPEAESGTEGGSGGDADAADRSVVTTGWARITVEDPTSAAQEAVDLVRAAGGRVESRTESPGTDTQAARAELTLRIPADDFEDVLDDLRELGEVGDISLQATDVTAQRQDLDARIEALEASVDRLIELLGQAATTADLIAIESELTTRQAELDSLTSQRDQLVDQVDYSTLSLEFVTPQDTPKTDPPTFWDGLVAGWTTLVAFGTGLLVVIGALLPWAIALALVAGAVLLVIWAIARGRRARRDGGSGSGTGTGTGTGTGA
ncbi:DUF4349 domain-containing protein [Agromyces sp. MMS24-JH15]|uniref:DUF4349 domain-containing protein n=1 Tax=Agromyces sp. MMS24-JH15 TaxID=3243765 RepID=UPI00374A6175